MRRQEIAGELRDIAITNRIDLQTRRRFWGTDGALSPQQHMVIAGGRLNTWL
jgi:hypothetical protein